MARAAGPNILCHIADRAGQMSYDNDDITDSGQPEAKKGITGAGGDMANDGEIPESGSPAKPVIGNKDVLESSNPLGRAGSYMMIPFSLLSCALVGLGIGWLLERKWPHGGLFLIIFISLGMIAGFKQVYDMTKKL